MSMEQYYDLLKDVLKNGDDREDRTGTGTISSFGKQLEFDLKEGFPILSGKYTSFKNIVGELVWFLSRSTNVNSLRKINDRVDGHELGTKTIWDEWANDDGDLGAIYGKQWRGKHKDGDIDQIKELLNNLIELPFSRRHIVSAWDKYYLPEEHLSPQENVENGKMALAPCHCLFQFYVRKANLKKENGEIEEVSFLSCHVYQRSADMFLGLPYNIGSYALLTHIIAHITDMMPDRLIMSFGDVHIYKNHINQVYELLSRDHSQHNLPKLRINSEKPKSIREFSIDEFVRKVNANTFELEGYEYYPFIRANVSV